MRRWVARDVILRHLAAQSHRTPSRRTRGAHVEREPAIEVQTSMFGVAVGNIATSQYERKKIDAARRSREQSRAGRDIGLIPEVVNPGRKAACAKSLLLYLETYHGDSFPLAWSDDHLSFIDDMERVILSGGSVVIAMPRGSGKSTIIKFAAMWAAKYGYRRFIVIIGPEKDHAETMLASLATRFSTSKRLLDDFPEVCYPVASLEGARQRANGQMCGGELTHLQWRADRLVLPVIEGSLAAGAMIRTVGLTGAIRGMVHTRTDGTEARPDLVLIDDPQTDESAKSPSQTHTRERLIKSAILGMAGPGKKIACCAAVTVIGENDLADRLLDSDRNPEWISRRAKLMYEFPTDKELWERYNKIRVASLREEHSIVRATEFYAENRVAMDAGARAGWPARFDEDEISAVQHCMNLRFSDPHMFWSEMQQEPTGAGEIESLRITSTDIMKRVNNIPRGIVPQHCTRLTCGIDVQGQVLFWTVVAFDEFFGGSIVAYGAWPKQPRSYFSARDVPYPMEEALPNMHFEGRIYAALERLTNWLFGRAWKTNAGGDMHLQRVLIDAGWGRSCDTVYEFCMKSPHASRIVPSHGKGIGPANKPMALWNRERGDQFGPNWQIPALKRSRPVKHVNVDVNAWKSFTASRFKTAIGDDSAVDIYGSNPHEHEMFADQMAAEIPIRTTGRGRTVDVWQQQPGHPDNHFFDCFILAAVAASIEGARLPGQQIQPQKKKKKTLAQLQRERRRATA